MYTLFKSGPLKTGDNKGKCVYYLRADDKNLPVISTRPLTVQEAEPLRRLAGNQKKIRAWIEKLAGGR